MKINLGDVVFERFKLLEVIGKGGNGTVFDCIDLKDELIDICIKVLHRTSDEGNNRIKREVEASKHLYGLGISVIQVIQSNIDKDTISWYVMPKLSELYNYISSKDTKDRVIFFLKILKIVEEIHKYGYWHRDIKLSNLFVKADGDPILADFGMVKSINETEKLTPELKGIGPRNSRSAETSLHTSLVANGSCIDVSQLGKLLWNFLTLEENSFNGGFNINQDNLKLDNYYELEELEGLDYLAMIIQENTQPDYSKRGTISGIIASIENWIEGLHDNQLGNQIRKIGEVFRLQNEIHSDNLIYEEVGKIAKVLNQISKYKNYLLVLHTENGKDTLGTISQINVKDSINKEFVITLKNKHNTVSINVLIKYVMITSNHCYKVNVITDMVETETSLLIKGENIKELSIVLE